MRERVGDEIEIKSSDACKPDGNFKFHLHNNQLTLDLFNCFEKLNILRIFMRVEILFENNFT